MYKMFLGFVVSMSLFLIGSTSVQAQAQSVLDIATQEVLFVSEELSDLTFIRVTDLDTGEVIFSWTDGSSESELLVINDFGDIVNFMEQTEGIMPRWSPPWFHRTVFFFFDPPPPSMLVQAQRGAFIYSGVLHREMYSISGFANWQGVYAGTMFFLAFA